jgi:hypothetical protein
MSSVPNFQPPFMDMLGPPAAGHVPHMRCSSSASQLQAAPVECFSESHDIIERSVYQAADRDPQQCTQLFQPLSDAEADLISHEEKYLFKGGTRYHSGKALRYKTEGRGFETQ